MLVCDEGVCTDIGRMRIFAAADVGTAVLDTAGAPARVERAVRYNRLLSIEDDAGEVPFHALGGTGGESG